MKISLILLAIILLSGFLFGQLKSDHFITTGFGPAALEKDYRGEIHIIWGDGSNHDVYYQLFDSLLNPQKNMQKISAKADVTPGRPRITINVNNICAVWDAMLYGITRWRIFGRILNINGDTLSTEFRIDSADGSISFEKSPDIVNLNDTTFMAIWSGNAHYGEVLSVVGRKINIHSGAFGNEIYMIEDLPPFNGGVIGAEMNSQTNEIFCLFGGDFYDDTLNNAKIYFRRYDLDGNPLIPSTLLLKDSSNYKIWEPHLSYNPLGKYTIIWSERKDSVWCIKLETLDLSGNQIVNLIQVNSVDNRVSQYPSLSIDFNSNGEAIVVWESVNNGKIRIYGQRFSSDGEKLGDNFRISTELINSDHFWPVVQLYNKNIITIWSSYDASASEFQLWGNVVDFDNPITGVSEYFNYVAAGYELKQNFPNPFNPITIINYTIPITAKVTMVVYDLLGNEVATLVDEERPAGTYVVNFDGSALSSGVYFYKLQAGQFSQIKKSILIK